MTDQISPLRVTDPPSPVSQARRELADAPAVEAVASPVLPNPQLRLDPGLGLVVLEFRDRGGEARTIPTERELDAYRLNIKSARREDGADAGSTRAPGSAGRVATTPREVLAR